MEANTLPAPTGSAIGTDPTRPTPGMCRCGCGVPAARRYKPGHDAKHHSTLAAALTSGDWRIATRAADLLAELGWTGYADRAALQAVPYRASNGIARQLVADVATWQVTPDGQHHCHRRCPALTAQARAAGALNRVTHLAADAWLTMVPNSPELAARLVSSWNQCTECSTDADRLIDAERVELQVASIMAPAERTVRKSSPTRWEVAPDTDGAAPIVMVWNHLTNVVARAWAPPTV